MTSFPLRIATLERLVFDQPVEAVTLPGLAGELTVLGHHMPLITPLVLGEITAKFQGEEFYLAVSGGMVEVGPDRVLVLADQAERAEELDEKLAQEARDRAERLKAQKREDEIGLAAAEAELQRALLHLKIIRKHRSRRGLEPPS